MTIKFSFGCSCKAKAVRSSKLVNKVFDQKDLNNAALKSSNRRVLFANNQKLLLQICNNCYTAIVNVLFSWFPQRCFKTFL